MGALHGVQISHAVLAVLFVVVDQTIGRTVVAGYVFWTIQFG